MADRLWGGEARQLQAAWLHLPIKTLRTAAGSENSIKCANDVCEIEVAPVRKPAYEKTTRADGF